MSEMPACIFAMACTFLSGFVLGFALPRCFNGAEPEATGNSDSEHTKRSLKEPEASR